MAASHATVFGAFAIRTSGTPSVVGGVSMTRSGGLMVIFKSVPRSLLTRVLLLILMFVLRGLSNR